jgi:hypothetical protein
MGWTVLSARPAGGWKAHLDAAIAGGSTSTCWAVLASAIGSDGNYYAAVERRDLVGPTRRHVYAVVGLIEGAGYKLMSEEAMPYYYAAPAEVLAKLEPTENKNAAEWRARCANEMVRAA